MKDLEWLMDHKDSLKSLKKEIFIYKLKIVMKR